MSKYTVEIREIVDFGINIFDFEYKRDPAAEVILPKTELEQGFIDHYFFREIGYETIDRFKQRLMAEWRESIEIFDKLLIAYSKPIDALSNGKTSTEVVDILNNTPNSALDYGEQSKHASSIAHNKANVSGYSGLTEVELLEKLHDKIKDIPTEFYKSFEKLFMTIY